MKYIKVRAHGKINLALDVLRKREDGYHIVEMIMQTIDLYDDIKLKELEEDNIIIKSECSYIPLNEDNIVYKAAKLIKEKMDIKKGIEIFIKKNIPVAAGMAGGSSNAAAVLVGLNELWELGLSKDELRDLGLKLGADVPFCIEGGTALAEGIGEKLTYIKGINKDVNILVCKPDIFVSTKEVYQSLDIKNIEKRPDNKLLIEKLKNDDIVSVSNNMVNVLEEVTSKKYSDIKVIEDIIAKNGAMGTMMSGSGPTVFGFFDNEEKAKRARVELLENYSQVYVVTSSEKGVEIYG